MRRSLMIGIAGLGLVLVGCSSTSTEAKETTDLRDSMTNSKPFDMNNVPEKDREMVARMRGGGGKPGGAPPAASK